jgi:very-short-patch-repair endonuclease
MMNYAENLMYDASAEIVGRAKELRSRMTLAEELLWQKIRGRKLSGYKFRRQHPINQFIADFYCHEVKLVVEVDGGIHFTPQHQEYDENRTATMNDWDIKLIRFTNEEVLTSMNSVLEQIRITCMERRGR